MCERECGESVFEHCIMMRKAHCAALQMELVPKCLSSSTNYFGIVSFNIQNNTHTNICDLFFFRRFFLLFLSRSRVVFGRRPPRIILHMHFQQFGMLLAEIRTTAYAHTTVQNELLYNSSFAACVYSILVQTSLHCIHISMANVCRMRSCISMNSIKKMNRFGGEWVSE